MNIGSSRDLLSQDEYEYGLDEEALATIADDIPAGGAAMMLVIEHKWMIPMRDAMGADAVLAD